jgi:hypothetical protein
MTHLWTVGLEITVQISGDGAPYSFICNGQLYEAAQVCNAWRVHTDWWRQEIWRDYYKLQMQDGLLCTAYHDLLTGRWHLARIYD